MWRFSGYLSGCIAAVVVFLVSLAFRSLLEHRWVYVGTAAPLVAFLVFGGLGTFFVTRQYELWRYQLREHDLLIKHGLIWRSERHIARDRVQHIDINSGPIDRKLGLVQLVIYAAGMAGSVGLIPGLRPTEAEWLKEQLLLDRVQDA